MVVISPPDLAGYSPGSGLVAVGAIRTWLLVPAVTAATRPIAAGVVTRGRLAHLRRTLPRERAQPPVDAGGNRRGNCPVLLEDGILRPCRLRFVSSMVMAARLEFLVTASSGESPAL